MIHETWQRLLRQRMPLVLTMLVLLVLLWLLPLSLSPLPLLVGLQGCRMQAPLCSWFFAISLCVWVPSMLFVVESGRGACDFVALADLNGISCTSA